MTESSSAGEASAAALGWPEDARQQRDDTFAGDVSRETSTGLGWPEVTR